jgi:hypothetical protein
MTIFVTASGVVGDMTEASSPQKRNRSQRRDFFPNGTDHRSLQLAFAISRGLYVGSNSLIVLTRFQYEAASV